MTLSPQGPPAETTLAEAFLPLHKRAFGMATGLVAALLMFLVTAIYLWHTPRPDFNLGLLAEYSTGYTPTWRGAVIGAGWGGFVGFVLGWFLAFGRNLLLAILLIIIRTRANLAQTRDFLDHI